MTNNARGQAAPAADSPTTDETLTDVHDMVVVHRAFRRELRLTPDLVRAVQPGDVRRAGVLIAHLRLVLGGLHLHHTGEDDLLWPLLAERAKPSADLVTRMQEQHHRVELALERLDPILLRWEREARPAVGEELASALEELRAGLCEHLDEEETHVLPLAARHLTQREWDHIGEHGLSRMSKRQLPLLAGMILEDATPEERAAMYAAVPAPARVFLKTIGARQYRRHLSSVRGPG